MAPTSQPPPEAASLSHLDGFVRYLIDVRRVSPLTAEAYSRDLLGFVEFLAATWGEGRAYDWPAVDYGIVRRYLAHLNRN